MTDLLSHHGVSPWSRPEETEDFRAWQREGDRAARERLVKRYTTLTRSLARRYTGVLEMTEDLEQVAFYGLLRAIDRFEPDRGIAFSSFAVPTVAGELRRHLRNTGWGVHVPRRAMERALELEAAVRELERGAGHRPGATELAEHLGWEISQVRDALQAAAAHYTTSTDATVASDGEATVTLLGVVGTEDAGFGEVDDRLTVAAAVRGLPVHARRALHLRFSAGLTQAEIGAQLGMSTTSVARLLRRSIEQARGRVDAPERMLWT